jgi:hypothetical protein
VKLRRIKNRKYFETGETRSLVEHAEYGVIAKRETLARIVFNRGKWIALELGNGNRFGRPVSPLNITRLRDVKRWAIERYRATT